MQEDKTLTKKEGVFVSDFALKKFADFETNYLFARSKEKRILTIPQIKKLPNVDPEFLYYKEWEIRKKNIHRFLNYLAKKKKTLRILDIGCGNGFFTNMMAGNNEVVGIDVNLTELTLAAEAFPNANIKWYYIDILSEVLPEINFDLITFCASFQYFEGPSELLKRCMELLNENGEIHIIDSPFYSQKTVTQAKQNSAHYYKELGNEEMIRYYNHNTYAFLNGYNFVFKYSPNSILNKFLRKADSPFPWLLIKKNRP